MKSYILFAGGTPPNMQLLYEAALCIWQLTFLDEAAEVIATTAGIVASLVEIARTAQKEKVCCKNETDS